MKVGECRNIKFSNVWEYNVPVARASSRTYYVLMGFARVQRWTSMVFRVADINRGQFSLWPCRLTASVAPRNERNRFKQVRVETEDANIVYNGRESRP